MVSVHQKLVLDAICIIEGIRLAIKQCIICGKEFDTKERSRNAITCSKECSIKRKAITRKQWRENNPERCRQYNKKWRENNPEYNKKWRENNLERCRQYNKKWRENNREHHNQYNKKWRENNPEYGKKWRENNREYMKQYCKQWYQDNLEYVKQYRQQWYQDNREYALERSAKYKDQHPEKYDKHKREKETPGLKEAKKMARQNANYQCELTGWKGPNNVHHLNGYVFFPDQRADVNNLIVLHTDVHKDFHSIYGYKGDNTIDQFFEFVYQKFPLQYDQFRMSKYKYLPEHTYNT